jgi:tetratricopeptide (TPR) repeat protein
MSAGLRRAFLAGVLSFGTAARATPQEDFAKLLKRGTALSQKGEYAGAAEAYQGGIALAPGSPETWMRWADFDLERFRALDLELRSTQSGMAVVLRLAAKGLRGGAESPEELLRQSATADPEQKGIWGELGVEQMKRGLREEAAATLKTALERQPKDLWTLRLEARMAAARGDWREAERHLLELGGRSPAVLRSEVESWPRDLAPKAAPKDGVPGEIWECFRKDTAECLDRIRFPGGEVSERTERLFAEERWERLAALPEPSGAPEWYRRGVALAELNDCERAIPALERGLEPGAETAAYWLELCYASEAERAAARLGALGSQAVFHRVWGDFLVRVKADVQGAIEEYAKARQLQSRDPVLAERLGQAYMSLGDVNRAKEAAREALALDPQRTVARRLLVSIAMNERDYPSALADLNELLGKNPNDDWARVETGIAYTQTGRPQEALEYLQPALAAGYPDERGALHAMLASVLRKLGREQEAQSAAEEANRLSDLFQQHGPATHAKERR